MRCARRSPTSTSTCLAVGAHIFGDAEHRRQNIAGMPPAASRPVIDVVHLDVARRGPIDERCHVGRCDQPRADDRGPRRLRHARGDIPRTSACLAEESADERTERVDDAHLGGVNSIGVERLVAQALGEAAQLCLDAVDRFRGRGLAFTPWRRCIHARASMAGAFAEVTTISSP